MDNLTTRARHSNGSPTDRLLAAIHEAVISDRLDDVDIIEAAADLLDATGAPAIVDRACTWDRAQITKWLTDSEESIPQYESRYDELMAISAHTVGAQVFTAFGWSMSKPNAEKMARTARELYVNVHVVPVVQP